MIFFSEQPALFSRLSGQRVVLRLWRLTVDLVHTKGTLSHQGSERLGFAPPLRYNPRNNLKTDTIGNRCRFSCRRRARTQRKAQATHNYTPSVCGKARADRNVVIRRLIIPRAPRMHRAPSVCYCLLLRCCGILIQVYRRWAALIFLQMFEVT